jgi:hypothetical protein
MRSMLLMNVVSEKLKIGGINFFLFLMCPSRIG